MEIGMDIVDVADIAESVDRFGARYLRRVFTAQELAACADGADTRRLAVHFAAKEATLKTLRESGDAIDWRSIEVHVPSSGAVGVELSGTAAEIARRHGIVALSVSVGATRYHAAAVAVAERSSEFRREVTGQAWNSASET